MSKKVKFSMSVIHGIEGMTMLQKANAIEQYLNSNAGSKLDAETRKNAKMRISVLRWTAKQGKPVKKTVKIKTLKNVRRGSIVISSYIHTVSADGTPVFTRGNEVLYGITPSEMETLRTSKFAVIKNKTQVSEPVNLPVNDQLSKQGVL